MKTVAVFLTLAFLGVSARGSEIATGPARVVSIIQLIGSPSSHAGKVVRVEGVLGYGFEESAIYLTVEHRRNHVSPNAIWLDLSELTSFTNEIQKLEGKYVVVEGEFQAGPAGHMGAFPGVIVKTKSVAEMPLGRVLRRPARK